MRVMIAVLVVAPVVFAQGRLNPMGNNGNILHPGIPASGAPGTGRTGVAPGGNILHPGIPATGGLAPLAPIPFSGGFQRGAGQRGGGFGRAGRTVILPYPLTVDPFYGGFSSGPGYTGAPFFQPQPGYYDPIWGIYNPGPLDSTPQVQQQPQSPTIVINQNFQPDTVRPVLRDYSNAQLPEPTFKQVVPAPQTSAAVNDQPTIYLIALKDHTIVPVLGYWMDKGALSYVTVDSVIGHVVLDQVDREFSQRLNDERHIEFRFPSGK
jgi:hypothetical protein